MHFSSAHRIGGLAPPIEELAFVVYHTTHVAVDLDCSGRARQRCGVAMLEGIERVAKMHRVLRVASEPKAQRCHPDPVVEAAERVDHIVRAQRQARGARPRHHNAGEAAMQPRRASR